MSRVCDNNTVPVNFINEDYTFYLFVVRLSFYRHDRARKMRWRIKSQYRCDSKNTGYTFYLQDKICLLNSCIRFTNTEYQRAPDSVYKRKAGRTTQWFGTSPFRISHSHIHIHRLSTCWCYVKFFLSKSLFHIVIKPPIFNNTRPVNNLTTLTHCNSVVGLNLKKKKKILRHL